MQGRIFHYLGALIPPSGSRTSFFYVKVYDTKYAEQTQHRSAAAPQLDSGFLQQLTTMLHQVKPYMQTFRSIRECAIATEAPKVYSMVTGVDGRP